MRCCDAELKGRTGAVRRWRGAGGVLGSGALLVLLPKCPVCVAAYLAVFTGVGVAASVAAHLRLASGLMFAGSLSFLLVRWFMQKRKANERSSE
jgi:hypothetical protein